MHHEFLFAADCLPRVAELLAPNDLVLAEPSALAKDAVLGPTRLCATSIISSKASRRLALKRWYLECAPGRRADALPAAGRGWARLNTLAQDACPSGIRRALRGAGASRRTQGLQKRMYPPRVAPRLLGARRGVWGSWC